MELIINDGLPRNISYPVKGSAIETALLDCVPEGNLGLYFLYISGVQLDHYDPLISKETKYPVLFLENGPPPLCSNVVGRLLQAQIDRERRSKPLGDPLGGVARAEAQLAGKDAEDQAAKEAAPELKLPPMSLVVLPVRTRFRTKVGELIESQGIRAMKNWLSCKPEMKPTQRPLVLSYDEASETLSSKFAEEWTDSTRPRFYF